MNLDQGKLKCLEMEILGQLVKRWSSPIEFIGTLSRYLFLSDH
jgi:hypothetical protein